MWSFVEDERRRYFLYFFEPLAALTFFCREKSAKKYRVRDKPRRDHSIYKCNGSGNRHDRSTDLDGSLNYTKRRIADTGRSRIRDYRDRLAPDETVNKLFGTLLFVVFVIAGEFVRNAKMREQLTRVPSVLTGN